MIKIFSSLFLYQCLFSDSHFNFLLQLKPNPNYMDGQVQSFGIDGKYKMSASAEPCLTYNPLGKTFKHSSSLKS